jgi:methylated-DNA-[protein]-cysteine S-methyltransferase
LTPAGPLTLLAGDDGVCGAGFTTDPAALLQLLPARQRQIAVSPVTDLGDVSKAIAAYFEGELAALDSIPVTLDGSAFQRAVWDALRSVPAGAPVSYRVLAARAGAASAVRAAGSACGRNPVAVIVPCHRIVRSDGGLGGYLWGLERKRWLLQHERRTRDDSRPTSSPISEYIQGSLPSVEQSS